MAVTINGSGQVPVQIVQATTQTQTSTTSTSYVASTLTATITPTNSSNRILVSATCPFLTTASAGGGLSIYRNSTKVFDPSAADGANTNFYIMYGIAGGYFNVPLLYLDSPATTSATTYTIYLVSYNGSSVRMPYAGGVTNSTGIINLTEMAYA